MRQFKETQSSQEAEINSEDCLTTIPRIYRNYDTSLSADK
jgi:hypothetical protein